MRILSTYWNAWVWLHSSNFLMPYEYQKLVDFLKNESCYIKDNLHIWIIVNCCIIQLQGYNKWNGKQLIKKAKYLISYTTLIIFWHSLLQAMTDTKFVVLKD